MLIRTVGAVAVAAVFASSACSSDPEPNWLALESQMPIDTIVEFQFTPEHTGPHQVVVQFDDPVTDDQVEALVASAAASTGAPRAPSFDFTWSVLHDSTAVARREAPQRHTGAVDTYTSGLGEGTRTSRGLVFGGCALEAGRSYTLRIEPGASLGQIARAHPRIKVVYQPNELTLQQ